MGPICGSGTSGVGNGNPLQCSFLGNLMDRGAWLATVHGVTKSWTQLTMHTMSQYSYWTLWVLLKIQFLTCAVQKERLFDNLKNNVF